VATPIDLSRLLRIDKPLVRVRYELQEHNRTVLPALIGKVLSESRNRSTPGRALTADAGR
jgi:predicted GTPase